MQYVNWILIIAISMVSFSILMFLGAQLSILEEAVLFYKVESTAEIIWFSNYFNVGYVVVFPLVFILIKRFYFPIICSGTILTAVGCIGRYYAYRDYSQAKFYTILVAIAHVPMISAPYGLLDLFPKHHQGYASSIPLFFPIIAINICIIYGIMSVLSLGKVEADKYLQPIDFLNKVIAIIGFVSAVLTIICLKVLRKQILQINKLTQEQKTCFGLTPLKSQWKKNWQFYVPLLSWGLIMGINWTFGGMFNYIFIKSGLNQTERAVVGLFANVSSIVFSNLGNWIANNTKFKNLTIIFMLNCIGFFGSLLIQGAPSLQMVFNMKSSTFFLIIGTVIFRAGFSSFVSLAFIELGKSGINSLLLSSIFFFCANGGNFIGNQGIILVDFIQPHQLLALLLIICMIFVELFPLDFDNQIMESQPEKVYSEVQQQFTSEVQIEKL